MKRKLLAILTTLSLSAIAVSAAEKAPVPVLDRYVAVSTALAADDLATAVKAAKKLAETATESGNKQLASQAQEVTDAKNIDAARESFKTVSATVIPIAEKAEGYYVVNCPMTKNGMWVQDAPQIANPYHGASMLTCGVIVKKEK